MLTLCRDCFAYEKIKGSNCPICGGARIVRHDELPELTIAHVDCDAFYASVEKRDDPNLKDRPLLIGHDGGRGVVTTACYMARRYGCRSAMPMFQALQLCPGAVVIPPDMSKYKAVSADVRDAFRKITTLFEAVSIDEAYLDLGSEHRLSNDQPASLLVLLAKEIENAIGITISAGLSYNKFLAKLASELDKPRGFSVIGRQEAGAFLSQLPVAKIHGVGGATAAKMNKLGWSTIADLQPVPERELVAHFGRFGHRLFQFVNGEDDRAVNPSRATKSISAETTFAVNVRSFEELASWLAPLCRRVTDSMSMKKLAGRTITLKLKSKDFQTVTRRRSLGYATQRYDLIHQSALSLLRSQLDGQAYRLIGVGLSDLCPQDFADPPDLLDILSY